MKYVILTLLIIISIAAYLLWPVRYEPEDWVSLRDGPEVERPVQQKKKSAPEKKVEEALKDKKLKEERSEVEYITDIRDVIKDQWEELEECENDFDEKFGSFLLLSWDERINFLNDPSNLDNYLDNLKSIRGTTPSSGIMIKELADPIAAKIDPNEMFETVGYVKTCRDNFKMELITALSHNKGKDKKIVEAVFNFLKSETSALTYPRILSDKLAMLKIFLFNLQIKDGTYPQIGKLHSLFQKYVDEDIRLPRNHQGFNYNVQKHSYEFAVIYQKEIQKALKEIKEDLLKH